MEPSQAAELVAYLVAVFRPRDFGDASAFAFAHSIQEFGYDDARRAVEWIGEHDTFMPALARLRSEIGDDYFAPPIDTLDRTALPGYAAVHAERPALPDPDPVRAEDSPVAEGTLPEAVRRALDLAASERHIPYDPEQVALRKAEARAAADIERVRLAEQVKAEGV